MTSESTTCRELLSAQFLQRLEQLALTARKSQIGAAKGERKSKRKGTSVEFADYRDYVQGDDLRHVDWNIYGRLESLYLKLFHEQEDVTVHLLIDASRSMGFGTPAKIELAAKLAAAIGYIGLIGYDRVSAESFADGITHRLAPGRGRAQAPKLLSFLSGVRANGRTALEDSTKSYVLRNRAKGVAVLFSDFLDPEGFEGCLRRLQQSGSDCYAIHILSRDEIDPPIAGDLKLLDSEYAMHVEVSASPALLKRYKQNLEGFCESVRKQCLARGIGYIFAPSDEPFERLTLDVLRRGGMLR
ncbi:MAG TPA: DUF58 domain-containing protein [Candidatus Hydrogenedentes bacterium]|nr:DUF58 domain-containing protein [Candidatus Hydrogenedentota bacterium]HRK34963.1 DUF58 domain-containing protein [Candidatus Hydrogenedentota bacterium]